jgi:DNA-binding transcriptional LysR family regulator
VEWDDLRFLIAVADAGNIDDAARALKLTPVVVTSRLIALEKALNCELVTRADKAVTITASGQRAVAVAREVAAKLESLATELGGARGELAGSVCVTSTAGFIMRAVKAFEALHAKYPALHIDTMISSHVVDLHRKDVDIAVRMFRDQQPGLTLRKLGAIGWSLYASPKYVADRASSDGHTYIAYDENFSNTAGGRWIAKHVAPDAIGMRVSGIRQAFDAATAHRGVCIVPCYLAAEQGLVRVTDEVVTTNEVYAACLSERANEARLSLVTDALVDMFTRDQAAFAGA